MSHNQTATAYVIPLQEAIIKAACEHFEINENTLLNEKQFNVAYMRHLCFYLIKKNTSLSNRFIGFRFKQSKGPVQYGIEIIESIRNVNASTLTDLRKIAEKSGISI